MALNEGRRSNGGHSTKAKKPIDKRKNEYKEALKEAATVQDVVDVIVKLKDVASTGDVPAIKLFLEYYVGKPKESIDITTDGESLNFKELIGFGSTKREV